jgi:hypothetical protein
VGCVRRTASTEQSDCAKQARTSDGRAHKVGRRLHGLLV